MRPRIGPRSGRARTVRAGPEETRYYDDSEGRELDTGLSVGVVKGAVGTPGQMGGEDRVVEPTRRTSIEGERWSGRTS